MTHWERLQNQKVQLLHLLRTVGDDEIDAAVLLAAFLGAVVGNRHSHAKALRRKAISIDALFHEEVHYVVCTLLGELHVELFGTGVVGVTFDRHVELLVHRKDTRNLGKARLEVGLEGRPSYTRSL